jgi:hypothetical protein
VPTRLTRLPILPQILNGALELQPNDLPERLLEGWAAQSRPQLLGRLFNPRVSDYFTRLSIVAYPAA